MSDSTVGAAPRDGGSEPAFELGLTLAGAVSAGAYTAGVIDFLIEALDAWHVQPDCPHQVKLAVISGASSGALVAAMTLIAVRSKFSPVLADTPLAERAANPLYDSTVNKIGALALLDPADIQREGQLLSLLNGDVLDRVADEQIFARRERTVRRWVANPLRLRFTLTNLDGVPYAEPIQGVDPKGRQVMTNHADAVRFAALGAGLATGAAPGQPGDWRHEIALQDPWPKSESPRADELRRLFNAALASAAFPLALPPRRVTKQRSDYRAIPLLAPSDRPCAVSPGGPLMETLLTYPAWPGNGDGGLQEFAFVAVDGGATNNRPLELARLALVNDEPVQRNPRDAITARKAVILVDPFAERPSATDDGHSDPPPIPAAGALAAAMVQAWLAQAHFRPLDATIAAQSGGGNYSRFLISPVATPDAGPPLPSTPAIASGVLAGFGGYLDLKLREHDYFLGRRNAQRFLAEHFVLDGANALFDKWTGDMRRSYGLTRDGRPFLPIVPLIGQLHPDSRIERLPAWPARSVNVDSLREPICERMNAAFGSALANQTHLGVISRSILRMLWVVKLREKLLDWILKKIRSDLCSYRPGEDLAR